MSNNLPNGSGSEVGHQLLRQILEWKSESGKVVQFVQPELLLEEMEKKLVEGNSGAGEDATFLQDMTSFVLNHCVDTSHPLFVNQLYGGCHPMGLAASFIVEKMNTNCHTYEAAPVFVLAERIVLKEVRKLFYGNETGDGIFAPGGSFSNFYGFTLARHQKFPEVKDTGLFGLPPMVIFTSQDSHYSTSKAANWMGIGIQNVIKVATNKEGQMIPAALQDAIRKCRAEGKVPLVVNATAGTTVLGAFDDLVAISHICESEGIWLHCDAAWGGSFIFSEKLRSENLKGIEKCDSIAWNAHKMLGAPLQCSAFITRHADSLSPCNSLNASYLFQPDKFYSVDFDRCGDKSFQCGRKADGFKLWFMWTALGIKGFKQLVENVEDCAAYFTEKIKERNDFLLYLDRHQCTNVFFWYIPQRLQNQTRDQEWWNEVSNISVKIKERMVLDGQMMIGYVPLPHKKVPNALRLVLPAYAPKTHEDMDAILQIVINIGNQL